MKVPPLNSKTISLVILSVIGADAMMWLTARAAAQGPNQSAYLAYGMLGIARGQTARLTVVTVGVQTEVGSN